MILFPIAGISTACFAAVLAAVFDGRFFAAVDFTAPPRTSRALDFAVFDGARFVAFLRAGLALALPRFELFLRGATPFRALAMVISCKIPTAEAVSEQAGA